MYSVHAQFMYYNYCQISGAIISTNDKLFIVTHGEIAKCRPPGVQCTGTRKKHLNNNTKALINIYIICHRHPQKRTAIEERGNFKNREFCFSYN